jgi:hypothetical protein
MVKLRYLHSPDSPRRPGIPRSPDFGPSKLPRKAAFANQSAPEKTFACRFNPQVKLVTLDSLGSIV